MYVYANKAYIIDTVKLKYAAIKQTLKIKCQNRWMSTLV